MSRVLSVLGCLLVMVLPVRAAEELCVSCDKPIALYRCTVEKSEELAKLGLQDKVLPPACEKILAKTGGHASCRVVGKPGDPCKGTERKLGLSDLQKALAGDGPSTTTAVPSLTDRAGEAAQSTGEAIGGAFKKTWNCVTSLFQQCG